jgi:hypothetical protein
MAVLLGDLKWCFDTPANPVIELALMRLGVPAFYATMLNDIDMHFAKSTVTAAGLTLDLASHLGCQGVHRQLHGTGQARSKGRSTGSRSLTSSSRWRKRRARTPSLCRRAVALRLRYLSRCTWATRRSPSQDPRRSRLSGGWSSNLWMLAKVWHDFEKTHKVSGCVYVRDGDELETIH